MNHETGRLYESSLDAESARALEEYHFSLAHRCKEDRPIRILSYPGSGRVVTIHCCDACYSLLWESADLDAVPARSKKAEELLAEFKEGRITFQQYAAACYDEGLPVQADRR